MLINENEWIDEWTNDKKTIKYDIFFFYRNYKTINHLLTQFSWSLLIIIIIISLAIYYLFRQSFDFSVGYLHTTGPSVYTFISDHWVNSYWPRSIMISSPSSISAIISGTINSSSILSGAVGGVTSMSLTVIIIVLVARVSDGAGWVLRERAACIVYVLTVLIVVTKLVK